MKRKSASRWDPEKGRRAAQRYIDAFESDDVFPGERSLMRLALLDALHVGDCPRVWERRAWTQGFFLGVVGHIPKELR